MPGHLRRKGKGQSRLVHKEMEAWDSKRDRKGCHRRYGTPNKASKLSNHGPRDHLSYTCSCYKKEKLRPRIFLASLCAGLIDRQTFEMLQDILEIAYYDYK